MPNDSLLDRIRTLDTAGGSRKYIAQMWRAALDAGDGDAPTAAGALPYLPFDCAGLGLDITENSTIVDIGCLGGYGLYNLGRRLRDAAPTMVGIDLDADSVAVGMDLTRIWDVAGKVSFCRGRVEQLPIAGGTADLVIAKLLLPYVRIRPALQEIARCLRDGGVAFFRTHSFGYYFGACCTNAGRPALFCYYARAIFSGMLFRLTRVQPDHRWFIETALGLGALTRLCRELGMALVWEGGDRARPMAAYKKECGKYPPSSRLAVLQRTSGSVISDRLPVFLKSVVSSMFDSQSFCCRNYSGGGTTKCAKNAKKI